MHIQILSAQEHLPEMDEVPTIYLLIDGEETSVEGNIDLVSAICGTLDGDTDLDSDGFVRNHALEALNNMLDPGHESFDQDFYDEVADSL